MPANASAREPAADRTVVITRVFDAPARLLFLAYSKPEHIMKWFGPRGWPVTMCEMDFRKGGRFRMAMTGPSGKQNTPFGGEYLEIVSNRKIVYDNGFESPGGERMVVTVTFDEKGGKTTLTISTLFGSVAMKNEHMGMGYEKGTNSGLDQLAGVAAAMSGGGSGRPIVASTFITLDGYMVGPDEDMSWVISGFDPELQADIAENMSGTSDAFIFGRVTYEIFAAYWPIAVPYAPGDALKPAEGREDPRIIRALNDFPKIVFSRTFGTPTWGNTHVVREGLEDEIRRLKTLPGKAISIQGSASIVQALARADLIDEYLLYVHPVLLGSGKPLFAAGVNRQDFERVHLKSYANGVVALRYRRKGR